MTPAPCPLCGARYVKRSWSLAASTTRDELGDHLIDYHQGQIFPEPRPPLFEELVSRARSLANILRAGGVHAFRLALEVHALVLAKPARPGDRQLDLFEGVHR